jgi:hypothetical protein
LDFPADRDVFLAKFGGPAHEGAADLCINLLFAEKMYNKKYRLSKYRLSAALRTALIIV